jgi:hypothetical protein
MKKIKQLPSLHEFIEKIQGMKKKNKLDLSSDQDLSIAIMNLISIEEHFFFSGAKSKNKKFYDLILEVRETRKQLLKQLVPDRRDGSETWCISKHLLAASMRLMEVGTKQLDLKNKKVAYDFFEKAYELYSLFWGLNLDLIALGDVKKIDEEALNKNDNEKGTLKSKLGWIVKKVVDCCLE